MTYEQKQLQLANDFEINYSKEQCELKKRRKKRINFALELSMWAMIVCIGLIELWGVK